MGKIIAIGGGENGRPGYEYETELIDKEIIRLTGKDKCNVLFIPTASNDSDGYTACMNNIFENKLGCSMTTLELTKKDYSNSDLREMILNTDAIYVGGGNTQKMITIWKEKGIDKLLHEAYENGVVLSGLSAGSICWFKYGDSDSLKFEDGSTELIRVEGINLINALHCPHYNTEINRKESLKEIMKTTDTVAIALDNCAALEIVDDKYRIITSNNEANGYRTYWKDGIYHEEVIEKTDEFVNIDKLLNI